MNQRDWIKLLSPREKKLIAWAMADQDALIRRNGEALYYQNVTEVTGEIVIYERLREEIIGDL